MYGERGIYLKNLADSVCFSHLWTPGICFSLN